MNLDALSYGPRRLTKSTRWAAGAGFVVGGVMLVWSAYIHFHLWQSAGYRHIPTIGTLFILQSIAGVVIGAVVLALRRVWVAILGVGFAVATLVGFLVSVEVGLFGFQDSWSAPFARQAFFVELAAAVALVVAAALCLLRPAPVVTRAARQPDRRLHA
jgi:hypothetical protein